MKNAMIVLASLAVSGAALAEGPSWTYGDISYWRADSVGDDEAEAYVLEGSFGFADKFHAQGTYLDGEQADQDFDGYRIKVGINPAVTDNTDFVFQVGYLDITQETGGNDIDVDGYSLTTGLRSMLADTVELFAYVNVDIADLDFNDGSSDEDATEVSAIVGGQYFFTDNVSLSLRYENGGLLADDAVQFGARYSF
jgi:hypothetical protein